MVTCRIEARWESGNDSVINEKKKNPVKVPVVLTQDMSLDFGGRALEYVNDSIYWFAGPNGRFGFTKNAGKTWTIDSVKFGDFVPEFRSISVVKDQVFLSNIGSPAKIIKIDAKSLKWETVFEDLHPDAFYDAMRFWNDQEGIIIGDPQEGCLTVVITRDGGSTWNKLNCDLLPAADSGEAAYAASNTNISIQGDKTWIATGGLTSRILFSPDKGAHWKTYDTPIIQEKQGDGMYSVDFYDEQVGFAIGGNWEVPKADSANKMVTKDGGENWELVSNDAGPGYSPCVQFLNRKSDLIAVSSEGVWFSANMGQDWTKISDERFYTYKGSRLTGNGILIGKNKIGFVKVEGTLKR